MPVSVRGRVIVAGAANAGKTCLLERFVREIYAAEEEGGGDIMPGFDRTEPQGMGSTTGGARGLCNPSGTGYAAGGYGRGVAYSKGFRGGFIFGRGGGRRFASRRYPQAGITSAKFLNEGDELSLLKEQASEVQGMLEDVVRRISELEKKTE